MALIKRTIELWFDPERTNFETGDHIKAFENAIGHLVAYGLKTAVGDSTVSARIEYNPILGEDGKRTGSYKPCEIVFNYKKATEDRTTPGYTQAAVARDAGLRYTYHS